MNKLFKRLGVTLLGFALAAGVGVGVASGVKTNQVNATDTSFDLSKSVPSGLTSSVTLSSDSTRGMGISKKSFDLTTTNSYTSVVSIKVTAATNYGGTLSKNTISAKVGSSSFGNSVGMTSKDLTDYTINSTAATGIVVISINNGDTANKNSIWVKTITITTDSAPSDNYTVTFDANGHGTAPAPVVVPSGEKVTKPADPTASGYTFGGWYTEAGCTNAYDFNTSVTSSFTLFAKWTAEGPSPVEDYALVTNISTLVDGDSVVIATDMDKAPVTGVTGFNGSKDATVSTTISEFKKYTVKKSSSNYLLYDDVAKKYIAKPTTNEFKYGDSTDGFVSVDGNGHLVCNSRYLCANGSSYRFYTGFSSYIPFFLYKVNTSALVSISTLSGSVSAKTGDSSWTITDVSVTGVLSDSPSVVDVSSYVNVSVVEAVPTIEQDGTMDVTLKATGKKETSVTKSVIVKATLSFVNPYDLRQIYGSPDNTTVTIDGIYMGDVRDAMIIMDGEYGANIYYGTGKVPAHEYIPGVTTLTVTGTTTLYKGLEEVKPTSVVELTDEARINKLQVPQTYICTGNETSANPELASRKTHATGYVTAISDASGNKNVTLSVNGKSIAVFVGSVYATEEVMSELNASKENQTNITIEGFTSFYSNNFQIQFTGLVKQKVDYLAENFAQDLLDLTDAVCEGYDGKTNNKDALSAVWLILQDADHYLGLAEEEQAKLVSAAASQTGTVIEKSMARYDYLAGKYGLTNFINRTITASSMFFNNSVLDNNATMIVIISVAVASISLLGVTIFLKKKRAIH